MSCIHRGKRVCEDSLAMVVAAGSKLGWIFSKSSIKRNSVRRPGHFRFLPCPAELQRIFHEPFDRSNHELSRDVFRRARHIHTWNV